MTLRLLLNLLLLCVTVAISVSCSTTKHVPDGKYLLDNATITIKDANEVKSSELYNYLRQAPNHKVLGFLKLQLATYNMAGQDTAKWYNKWLKKLGQAPVIFDYSQAENSAHQLQLAMINKGYMDATVTIDTTMYPKKKKIDVNYIIHAGKPHIISSIKYEIPDTAISRIVLRDSTRRSINSGDRLNRDDLDAERTLILERLRNNGYYAFKKDYITFIADTTAGNKNVDLTMLISQPSEVVDSASVSTDHQTYHIRNVHIITDYNMVRDTTSFSATDIVVHNGLNIYYNNDKYLKPQTIDEKCYIRPGDMYRVNSINRTYESLGQLGILKYINIEAKQVPNSTLLDFYILLSRNKKQSISVELEGTNSEGDLGFGLGLTYQHRNLAKGSELLTAKARMAYESLSGDLDGLINDNYIEFAGEVGITFPKFECPFISKDFKRRMRASTEFAVSFTYQERPEYTRTIAGAAWRYRWSNRQNTQRHTFDFIDLDYVYLPKSTIDFIDQVAPDNPLLRYSYEDHLIMKMGYTYYKTNRRTPNSMLMQRNSFQQSVYTLRASAEIAGNLLYGISNLIGQNRYDGVYKIVGVPYSQYAKVDFDYTYTHHFNLRNSIAFHVGTGIGVPYGNSRIMPFEKRFYAGGANGVRGWGVRALGPGSYDSHNSSADFINQCGDIRLDLSLEYRAKLFWVFEGALFIDAGNIWTIHNYENQPGGMFHFNSFYKEIAMSYGAGIRLDFTYFLLRFDLGMKAYNPAQNQERWPLIHPKWGRDATFHFAVGYPF